MKNIQLSNYCRWNDLVRVAKFLDENRNISISYENGIYFKFAFKHSNNDMLDMLLSYYYNQHNPSHFVAIQSSKMRQILHML